MSLAALRAKARVNALKARETEVSSSSDDERVLVTRPSRSVVVPAPSTSTSSTPSVQSVVPTAPPSAPVRTEAAANAELRAAELLNGQLLAIEQWLRVTFDAALAPSLLAACSASCSSECLLLHPTVARYTPTEHSCNHISRAPLTDPLNPLSCGCEATIPHAPSRPDTMLLDPWSELHSSHKLLQVILTSTSPAQVTSTALPCGCPPIAAHAGSDARWRRDLHARSHELHRALAYTHAVCCFAAGDAAATVAATRECIVAFRAPVASSTLPPFLHMVPFYALRARAFAVMSSFATIRVVAVEPDASLTCSIVTTTCSTAGLTLAVAHMDAAMRGMAHVAAHSDDDIAHAGADGTSSRDCIKNSCALLVSDMRALAATVAQARVKSTEAAMTDMDLYAAAWTGGASRKRLAIDAASPLYRHMLASKSSLVQALTNDAGAVASPARQVRMSLSDVLQVVHDAIVAANALAREGAAASAAQRLTASLVALDSMVAVGLHVEQTIRVCALLRLALARVSAGSSVVHPCTSVCDDGRIPPYIRAIACMHVGDAHMQSHAVTAAMGSYDKAAELFRTGSMYVAPRSFSEDACMQLREYTLEAVEATAAICAELQIVELLRTALADKVSRARFVAGLLADARP